MRLPQRRSCAEISDVFVLFLYGLSLVTTCGVSLGMSFTIAFGVEITDNAGTPITPAFWPTSWIAETQASNVNGMSLLRDVQRVSYEPFPMAMRMAMPNASAITAAALTDVARSSDPYELLKYINGANGSDSIVDEARDNGKDRRGFFASNPIVCPGIEKRITEYTAALERSYLLSAPFLKALTDPVPGTTCAAMQQEIKGGIANHAELSRVFDLLNELGLQPNVIAPEWLLVPRDASVCSVSGGCPPIERTSGMNSTYEPPVLTTQLVIAALIGWTDFLSSDTQNGVISNSLRDKASKCFNLPVNAAPDKSICDQIYGPSSPPLPVGTVHATNTYGVVDFVRDSYAKGLLASNSLPPGPNLPLCVPESAFGTTVEAPPPSPPSSPPPLMQSNFKPSDYTDGLTSIEAVQSQSRALCEAVHTWGLYKYVTVDTGGTHRVIGDPTKVIDELTGATEGNKESNVIMSFITSDPYEDWFLQIISYLNPNAQRNASASYKPIRLDECDVRLRSVAYIWYVWGLTATGALAAAASSMYGLTLGLGVLLSLVIYFLIFVLESIGTICSTGSGRVGRAGRSLASLQKKRIRMRHKPLDPIPVEATLHCIGVYMVNTLLDYSVKVLNDVNYNRPVQEGRYNDVGLVDLAPFDGTLWMPSRRLSGNARLIQTYLVGSAIFAVLTWLIRRCIDQVHKAEAPNGAAKQATLKTKRARDYCKLLVMTLIFPLLFVYVQILFGQLLKSAALATLKQRLLSGSFDQSRTGADLCASTTSPAGRAAYESAVDADGYKKAFSEMVNLAWNVHAFFVYTGGVGGLYAVKWVFQLPAVDEASRSSNSVLSYFRPNFPAYCQPAGIVYLVLAFSAVSTWFGIAVATRVDFEKMNGVDQEAYNQLLSIFGNENTPLYNTVFFLVVFGFLLCTCLYTGWMKCQQAIQPPPEPEFQEQWEALRKTGNPFDPPGTIDPLSNAPLSGGTTAAQSSHFEQLPLLALAPHASHTERLHRRERPYFSDSGVESGGESG